MFAGLIGVVAFVALLAAAWIPPSVFAAFYARHRNRRAMNVIDVLDIL